MYLHTGRLSRLTKHWHDRYGEVVRIAPDGLSYNSSDAWEDIHGWTAHLAYFPSVVLRI